MIQTRKPPEQIHLGGFHCACADHPGHMTSVFVHAAFMNPTDLGALALFRAADLPS